MKVQAELGAKGPWFREARPLILKDAAGDDRLDATYRRKISFTYA